MTLDKLFGFNVYLLQLEKKEISGGNLIMMDKEIEGFFIEDEKKYKQEDIIRLINKLKQYAKLVGKEGRVHIEDKSLSGTDRSKVFLIARYLGSELSKLKPELGIKKSIESVTTKEFAEILSIDEPNARARISQLVDEGFAKRPTKGSVQVEPFQIERFLDTFKKSKEKTSSRLKTKKVTIPKKVKIPERQEGEIAKIDEEKIIDSLSEFLSVNREKMKDIIHIRSNGVFKFHHMPGKNKAEKQQNCVLCSGFIYSVGFQKKTFTSRELSDICYQSGVDTDGLNYTIRHMKERALINKAGRRSQENILREKGKTQAQEILKALCK